jgi:hypothetical protein
LTSSQGKRKAITSPSKNAKEKDLALRSKAVSFASLSFTKKGRLTIVKKML